MCGRANTFALRVRGDSMVEDHIQNGDIIVLEQRQTAESGETVVALIDNSEATVKRFYRENNQIHLKPANDAYKPLILSADRVRVQGVVKGVLHYA
jgi:repressor LexA